VVGAIKKAKETEALPSDDTETFRAELQDILQ
jgi:hypothetical protein